MLQLLHQRRIKTAPFQGALVNFTPDEPRRRISNVPFEIFKGLNLSNILLVSL